MVKAQAQERTCVLNGLFYPYQKSECLVGVHLDQVQLVELRVPVYQVLQPLKKYRFADPAHYH